MKYSAAIVAALAAHVSAGTESASATSTSTPQATQTGGGGKAGCQETVEGSFKLTIVENGKEKRGIEGVEVSNRAPSLVPTKAQLIPSLHPFPPTSSSTKRKCLPKENVNP